jgi:hypothetical protein
MNASENLFASSEYTAGQLNAMVKIIIKQTDENGPVRLLNNELDVVPKISHTIVATFTEVIVDETQTIIDAIGNIQGADIFQLDQEMFERPLNGKIRKKTISLFSFNRGISPRRRVAIMQEAGYVSAHPWDLISLSKVKPDLQRRFYMHATNNGTYEALDEGTDLVFCLGGDSKRRFATTVRLSEIKGINSLIAGILLK